MEIASKRFKKSPFFDSYHHDDTVYGVYNKRLYPLDCGFDSAEHYRHLKQKACVYDVPETPLKIIGKDSVHFLEKLFTRNIVDIKVGRAVYAFACDHDGGIMMDGVLMRPNDNEFIYVQADGDFLSWAKANAADYEVTIEDFDSWVLQVQGPTSLELLEKITGLNSKTFRYYSVTETEINSIPVYLSRTGWTGEKGFEIYTKGNDIDGVALIDYLLEEGKSSGLIKSDIGSMHIRRIEAGILDYGTDFDSDLNPYQIGLEKFIDWNKTDFNGKRALQNTQEKDAKIYGMKVEAHTPNAGEMLMNESGDLVGTVTAGAWSPYFDCGIAIVRLSKNICPTERLLLQDGSKKHGVDLIKLPFYDEKKLIPKD